MTVLEMPTEDFGLTFGKPKIVMTSRGEREVRNAPATEAFWEAWRSKKEWVKERGYGVSKDYTTGKWVVSLWAATMSPEDRTANLEASRAADSDIELPMPAGRKPYPFQRAGVAYALKRDGTLIGDEMGLGKTIQAILFANAVAAKRIVVVAPASLLLNWRNEIRRWQTLDLPVFVIRPGRVFTGKPEGWYIINYDIVSRYETQLKLEGEWDLMVLDECQYLKTRTAKRTLTLLGGKQKSKGNVGEPNLIATVKPVPAKRILALTGTPIMNRPAELFPILHRLDEKRWPTWTTFKRRYCGYDPKGAQNLDELNARLRETVMVRRLKKDVLTELPAKTRQIVSLDVDDPAVQAVVDQENAIFEQTEKAVAAASYAMQAAEADGDEARYRSAVAQLQQVQGIAFSEMARVRHETAIAKLPQVIEHLESIEGKCLVFAHHHSVIDGLRRALASRGVLVITGDTPVDEKKPGNRQEIVDRFQTDPNIQFFVGQTKAAGVGLTLTAASHAVFAELDWTPAVISQAEDRAHRIGQAEAVLIQHLVLDGSLDARMAKMLIEKQEVIEAALDAKVASTEKAPPEKAAAAEPIALAEPPIEPPKFQESPQLTPAQIKAVHSALRIVASYDGDRASTLNGVGFSKMDTQFGCELAARDSLTPRQATAARKMVRKYKRQYPADLYEAMYGAGA